jgi:hypothetical protein
MTVKNFYEEEINEVDRKDVDNPQSISEFAFEVC